MDDTVYKNIAEAIIKKQVDIIGHEVAIRKAHKVSDMIVDQNGKVIRFTNDPVKTIGSLVQEYANLSADAALRFSRDAAKPFITPNLSLPKELRENQTD